MSDIGFEKELKDQYTQDWEIINRTEEVKRKGKVGSNYDKVGKKLFPLLDEFLPYESVLDLGCGCGRLFIDYKSIGGDSTKKVGVDMTLACVEKSKQILGDKAHFVCAKALDYLKMCKDSSFDLVVFTDIQHVPEQERLKQILFHMVRVAKKIVVIVGYSSGPEKFTEGFFGSENYSRVIYYSRQPLINLLDSLPKGKMVVKRTGIWATINKTNYHNYAILGDPKHVEEIENE